MKSRPSDSVTDDASGWYSFAKLLYADLISVCDALLLTCRTSYRLAAEGRRSVSAKALTETLSCRRGKDISRRELKESLGFAAEKERPGRVRVVDIGRFVEGNLGKVKKK